MAAQGVANIIVQHVAEPGRRQARRFPKVMVGINDRQVRKQDRLGLLPCQPTGIGRDKTAELCRAPRADAVLGCRRHDGLGQTQAPDRKPHGAPRTAPMMPTFSAVPIFISLRLASGVA